VLVSGVEHDAQPRLERAVSLGVAGRRLDRLARDRLIDRDVVVLVERAVVEAMHRGADARGDRRPPPRPAGEGDAAATARLRVARARRRRRVPAEAVEDAVAAIAAEHVERGARRVEADARLEIAEDLLLAPEREADAQVQALAVVVHAQGQPYARLEAVVEASAGEET